MNALGSTAFAALLLAAGAGPVAADAAWPNTPASRLEAFAVVQTLNAELLSHDSATLVLEEWCSTHRLAQEGRVVAVRVRDVSKPATDEIRKRLGVDDAATVGYRRVRLRCGDKVLSEADNWYVPSRLTPEMNTVLETTDTAFGRVVRPLGFVRRTISAEMPWKVLPDGWTTGEAPPPKAAGAATLEAPDIVLQHRAVLTLPDGTPFSLVVESYTGAVIAFPRPRLGLD